MIPNPARRSGSLKGAGKVFRTCYGVLAMYMIHTSDASKISIGATVYSIRRPDSDLNIQQYVAMYKPP